MKRTPVKDLAASVRQRLQNYADAHGQELQLVLASYGVERFLYRMSRVPVARPFVLKGATLFHVWERALSRPTRDVDFLGVGEASPEAIARLMPRVCEARVPADGLAFVAASVEATAIRGHQEYGGVRVKLTAMLGPARIPLRIDVGFGDAVTPRAQLATFPALLDLPTARVRVYPPETVVAEKFQAMVALGLANTRLKDFYDVLRLAARREFEGRVLAAAIRATFDRRRTAIPDGPPPAFGAAFSRDAERQAQWRALLSRGRLNDAPAELPAAVTRVAEFVVPAARAAARREPFTRRWRPIEGWGRGRARSGS